jgi:hypothetical protein
MDPNRSFVPKGALLRRQCAQLKLREQYVQRDATLPCVQGRARSSLPDADVTLVVPSPACLTHLLPVLATLPLPPRHEFLVLQTVLKAALDDASGRRQQLQLKTFLLESPSAPRRVLLNECTPLLFSGQRHGDRETTAQHRLRLFANACRFLSGAGRPVTVLACDTLDPVHAVATAAEVGVRVTTVAAYIATLQSASSSSSSLSSGGRVGADDALARLATEAAESLDHLRAKQQPSAAPGPATPQMARSRYPPHVDAPALRAGLASGSLRRGRLFISKHHPHEGHVEASHGGQVVLVCGVRDLNRGMDGDEVVVRVHPRGRWRRAAAGEVTLSEPSDASAGTAPSLLVHT